MVTRAPQGRPARLSREMICNAAEQLLASSDAASFSLRALGEQLGVDPTAVYRHFADKDDLLREVGDRALRPVVHRFASSDDPRGDIERLCSRLRATLIRNPIGLNITASGPTRRTNELRITEIILDALHRAGLDDEAAVTAYHVIIEYTLGSAWLDAPLAATGADRAGTYRAWRADYALLDAEEYPTTRQLARKLYPSSNTVFATGLTALVSGLVTDQ